MSMEKDNPFRSIMIKQISEADRPRERALNEGIDALQDHELIALLLGGGMAGLSVIDLSKQMLEQCENSLPKMAHLRIAEMVKKFKGVGPAKAVTLAAAFELGRRHNKQIEAERLGPHPVVTSSKIAYEYMRHDVQHLEYEEFWVLYLDRANHIKGRRLLSQGGTTMTVVDVKLLLHHALDVLADGLIAVHNHPSGSLRPSTNDNTLTRNIAQGAKAVGIRFLDHLIITNNGYYSYADEGRMP